jgi:hypothetical protein
VTETRPAPPESRSGVSVWKVLLLALVAVVLGGGVWLMWALSRYGEPESPPGLPIDNRTDEELLIYAVLRKAGIDSPVTEEVLFARIPAHAKRDSGIDCAAGELLARTSDGTEIARRERQDQCNEEPWVIKPPT